MLFSSLTSTSCSLTASASCAHLGLYTFTHGHAHTYVTIIYWHTSGTHILSLSHTHTEAGTPEATCNNVVYFNSAPVCFLKGVSGEFDTLTVRETHTHVYSHFARQILTLIHTGKCSERKAERRTGHEEHAIHGRGE